MDTFKKREKTQQIKFCYVPENRVKDSVENKAMQINGLLSCI